MRVGSTAFRKQCTPLLRALGDSATKARGRCSAKQAALADLEREYDEGDEDEPWPVMHAASDVGEGGAKEDL